MNDNDLPMLDAIARNSLAQFGLSSDLSVSLINLSENATYRVAENGAPAFALRVHRAGYHSKQAIQSELEWLMALRADDIVTTPIPVVGLDGELIQSVSAPNGESRHVVLSRWEEGQEPDVNEDLSASFGKLGQVTAKMHAHAKGWQRPEGFTRLIWSWETALGDEAPHWGRWRDGMGMDDAKRDLFAEATQLVKVRLDAFGSGPDDFGLSHCDLRLANLLVDGEQVKVLDFDDCGFSWFMYDAATPVSFYEHIPQVPGLIANWLEGYARVRAPSQKEVDEIPTLIMLRRLLLVAWIGSHSETELAQSMGVEYTAQTVDLVRDYLKKFG